MFHRGFTEVSEVSQRFHRGLIVYTDMYDTVLLKVIIAT